MARAGTGLIDRLAHRRAARNWARLGRAASKVRYEDLTSLRSRARSMQSKVAKALANIEDRIHQPTSAFSLQDEGVSEWSWRPDMWRGQVSPTGLASVPSGARFGEAVKIFHDCALSENALRQIPNTRSEDLTTYGLRVDICAFTGSFMSVVVDLPVEALAGLSKRNLLRFGLDVSVERGMPAYARLNLKHGPNTEQLVQSLPLGFRSTVDFDLGFTELNENRIEGAWVELIFDKLELNQGIIHDLHMSRCPRAEL